MPLHPYARAPDGTEPPLDQPDFTRVFVYPPWHEGEGCDDEFTDAFLAFEAEGAAESASWLVEGLGEQEGAEEGLLGVPVVGFEDEGAADAAAFPVLEFEAEGGEDGSTWHFQALQEAEGGSEEVTGPWLVPAETEGHAELVLQVELLALQEGEGQADVGVWPPSVPQDEGHAGDTHRFDVTTVADADTYVDATAVNQDSNFDASATLILDSTVATERHSYLRFKRDYGKTATRTFGTDATKPYRRLYGEGAVWQFDADDESVESAVNVSLDSSGRALHLRRDGGVTLVDGTFGKAYSFDGVNDNMKLRTTANAQWRILNLAHGWDFTVAFRMKRNGAPGAEMWLVGVKGDLGAAAGGWAVTLTTAGRIKAYVSDGVTQYTFTSDGTTSVVGDAWTRVAVRRFTNGPGDARVEVHVNGVANGGDTQGDNVGEVVVDVGLTTAANVCVGSAPAGADWYAGSLDEVRVYPWALTAADADDVLQNPYETVSADVKTLTSANLLLKPTATSALAQSVRAVIVPDRDFSTAAITWNRRPIRLQGTLDDSEPFIDFTIGTGTGQVTVALTGAFLTRLREEMRTGAASILLLMNDAAASRSLVSKEGATAADRPQLQEVFTVG